jgi:hypothetical protein
VNQAYSQQKALRSVDSHIKKQNFLTDFRYGQVTAAELPFLEDKMDPGVYADLKQDVARLSKYIGKNAQKLMKDFEGIEANRNNPAYLSGVDKSVLNKHLDFVMERYLKGQLDAGKPAEDNLLTRAKMAANYNVAFPRLNEQLSSTLRAGSLEDMVEAARAIRYLGAHGRGSLAKFDAKELAAANDMLKLTELKVDPIKAAELARKKLEPLTSSQYAQLSKNIEPIVRTQYTGPLVAKENAAKLLGLKKDKQKLIPPGLVNDFATAFEDFYIDADGDIEATKMKTKDYLAGSWRETHFNGFPEVMKNPIELIAGSDSVIPLRAQLLEMTDSAFKKQKELFDSGESTQPFYFEFADKAMKLSSGHVNRNLPGFPAEPLEVPVEKVLANGQRVKGLLVIDSDQATSVPANGKPSWAVLFKPEGKPGKLPINDPKTGSTLRFLPDFNALNQSFKQKAIDTQNELELIKDLSEEE